MYGTEPLTRMITGRPSHNTATADDFPLLFATPPRDGTVALYQATLLQDSPSSYSESPPVYLVTPYRLFQPSPDLPTFCVPLPVRFHDGWDLLFVTDQPGRRPPRHRGLDDYTNLWDFPPLPSQVHHSPGRDVFYQGSWRSTGRALASMYCSTLIPILQFTDSGLRAPWPRPVLPTLPITSGSPEIFRAWERRWDPDTWQTDIAREFEEPELPDLIPPSPTPTPTTAPVIVPASPPVTSSVTAAAPTFVLDALIRDAISRHTTCPITMEPLTTPSQIAVTRCYHLFDATALATWRTSGQEKCPTCRATL